MNADVICFTFEFYFLKEIKQTMNANLNTFRQSYEDHVSVSLDLVPDDHLTTPVKNSQDLDLNNNNIPPNNNLSQIW
jgi:hypothetical protein